MANTASRNGKKTTTQRKNTNTSGRKKQPSQATGKDIIDIRFRSYKKYSIRIAEMQIAWFLPEHNSGRKEDYLASRAG